MDFIVRIDDRLIHGQVTAGWVRPLGIERIILANDQVANDEWEREIYALAVPPEIEAKIVTVNEAVGLLNNMHNEKKTMVLINSLPDALRLLDGGVLIRKINIGGLHYTDGKKSFTSFIFLSDTEIQLARNLLTRGVILEGREIPGSPSINLADILQS